MRRASAASLEGDAMDPLKRVPEEAAREALSAECENVGN